MIINYILIDVPNVNVLFLLLPPFYFYIFPVGLPVNMHQIPKNLNPCLKKQSSNSGNHVSFAQGSHFYSVYCPPAGLDHKTYIFHFINITSPTSSGIEKCEFWMNTFKTRKNR